MIPCARGGPLARAADWLGNWQSAYAAPNDPLGLSFQTFSDGSAQARVVENKGMQERSWRFVPEEDGVRLWMTLKTHEPLPGALSSNSAPGFQAASAKISGERWQGRRFSANF